MDLIVKLKGWKDGYLECHGVGRISFQQRNCRRWFLSGRLQKPQGVEHKLYQQQLSEEFFAGQKLLSCEEDEQGDKDELIKQGDKGSRSILLHL